MSLFRQGSHFIVIGLLQLLLDWAIFVAATALGMPAAPGNLLGRSCGALLGFWLNGRITFADGGQQRLGWKRFGRFLALWLAMTVVSTWLVAAVAHGLGLQLAWLAKPVVEGGLAALSFFLLRHVVYR
ncbi:GtrA family protein [Flavobacterium sp. MXW15]|uniref:GtrA family protein n=1 Tax=Xanthomonas chitinilytica TaxID=2989819 RepID=A0ABT3JT98_9XANT|nr:GtrA family protein [Xanthomonas sp. H13-6]MCW4454480.1 GtrA family protein [Flavobacterium sp. MXW15]MCW4471720.1 GtrA family protein [Xanthomonas sp. H13-6]